MKKLFMILMMLTFSIQSFADCTKVYEEKAERRAKVNKVLKQVGVVTAGVLAITGGLIAVSAMPIVAAGLPPETAIIILGIAFTGGGLSKIKETKKNSYFKVLASIEGAKNGVLPLNLLKKIHKKIPYSSLTDFEQNEINRKVIDIIIENNESNKLCEIKNGAPKALNFNKFSRFIADELIVNL